MPGGAGEVWGWLRSAALAPALSVAAALCVGMSVLVMLEAAWMSAVSLGVKLSRRSPEKRYKFAPIGADDGGVNRCDAGAGSDVIGGNGDEECGKVEWPLVLVQIPMYNEREVYKLSIGAACNLTWPHDRIIIQVLDDSTDQMTKELVRLECEAWAEKRVNIRYEVRSDRKGYKAGALRKGLEYHYAQECEFVAIFDADFQPESNFLLRVVPFLVYNAEIALVQTRWEFVNYDVCLMTRIQRISLDYHFKVEQVSGSSVFDFFGFNGTAGVWRLSAINEAGGWKDRTTVEDMDLAVRVGLKGWKFLYFADVRVKSELPCTLKAYRHQQHRWTCGAANLFRKIAWEIVINKEVSLVKKLYLLYSFFFVRRVVAPLVTFLFYCVVVPLSVFIPEVRIPLWALIHIPTTISILTAIQNPSSLHIMPFWILFENVMAMHRMRAAVTGLCEGLYVDEWVVTEKLGENIKEKLTAPLLEPVSPPKCIERFFVPELMFGMFLFVGATYDIIFADDGYFLYMYLQAMAFIVVGFGFVGTAECCLQ